MVKFWRCIRSTTGSTRALGLIVLGPGIIASSVEMSALPRMGPPPEPALGDTRVVDDEAGVPAAHLELLADGLEAVVEPAGGNVAPHVGFRARVSPPFAPSRGSPTLPQSALQLDAEHTRQLERARPVTAYRYDYQ